MSKQNIAQKRLRGLIKRLSSIRGRHTELITVYVPAGTNLNVVSTQIAQEQGTAANIKSKAVRKNVLSALEKISQYLKLYKQTPPNGLAVFSGNVSDKEGEADIDLWAVEPPEKLNQRLYRCDQDFVLDPLQHMVREKEVYGLMVLDKSEADVGILKGKRIEPMKHIDSLVPGKTKKGGWSQARYARVREGLLHDHLKKAGEIATSYFRELQDLRGIVIGGPGPIKDMFFNGDYLPTDVKSKVLGVVDTSYTGTYGLSEILERADDILAEASVTREKKLLESFFSELSKENGLAVYGIKETIKALESGAVEKVLISEDFEWSKAKMVCPSCGHKMEKMIKRGRKDEVKCPECDSVMDVESKTDAAESIDALAEKMGSEVEVVSTDTGEGEQLYEMGGIAGMLRYPINL